VKRRFSEAQILGFLREAAAGTPVLDLCWNHCFSRSSFRAWKAKYGAAIDAQTGRLKQLEVQNGELRRSLARANSDLERLRRATCAAALPPAPARSVASHGCADASSRARAAHDAD
jgi:putative transposase